MPIKQAAIKALRQTKKRTQTNELIRRNLDFLIRRSRRLIKLKKTSEANEVISRAAKALDKAAQKRVIKKNTASRIKSRLMVHLNQLSSKK